MSCKYCGPRRCTCFPDPDETERELRADLEAARAEIMAEKAAHNLTRAALESCIASENAKSAEIAALNAQCEELHRELNGPARDAAVNLIAEIAALNALPVHENSVDWLTKLRGVESQRDAAIAALELVKSDIEYIAESLDCFRPADDGGDYCNSVDDCMRCGLLEALAKVGDIDPGVVGHLKTALDSIVTHAASKGGPWAESKAREALAKLAGEGGGT